MSSGGGSNVVFTFNKFFYDLVKEMRSNSSLKPMIKKHYSVRNKETRANIDLFKSSVDDDVIKCLVSSSADQVFTFACVGAIKLFVDADVSDILLQVGSDLKDKVLGYIYILVLLVVIEKNESDQDLGIDLLDTSLFMTVMHAIDAIQKNEPFDTIVESIMDEDVTGLVERIAANSTFAGSAKAAAAAAANATNAANAANADPASIESKLSNTKIGSIAKEIAETIDLKGLNLDKPEDLLNGSNGNLIGDLVSKVGSKLQQKFESGDVSQDDLIKEAVSMMGMFGGMGGSGGKGGGGGMDMFANIMKTMAKASGGGGGESSSTKERLRKKLEDKRQI